MTIICRNMLFINLPLNAYAILVALITTLLYLPISSFSGFSTLIDVTTRLNPNDAYVSTYYFWWTNLTYLPTFFFTVFSLLIWYNAKRVASSSLIIVCLMLMAHGTELTDYLILNSPEIGVLYGTYGLNPLLSNIMNRYHPLIFYLSVSLFTLVTFLFVVLHSAPRFYFLPQNLLTKAQSYGWNAILLNLIALWMGGWWALQEGTWGGWWNWDPSETFGLLVTLGLLTTLHSALKLSNIPRSVTKALFNFLIFLVTYFFIQLNFDLVSHNFGSKFFFFFNNNLFFLEMSQLILLTFALITYGSYNTYRLCVYKPTKHWVTAKSWVNPSVGLVAPTLITLFVLWSLRPLVNYFLWNFFELNIGNWEPSLKPILLLLGITLFFWTRKTHRYDSLVSFCLLSMSQTWLIIPLLFSESKSWVFLLHTLITIFTYIDLLTHGLSPIEWITESYNYYVVFESLVQLPDCQTFIVDANAHEITHITINLNGLLLSDWNLVTFANTPSNNFFLLNSQVTDYRNFYYLGNLYSSTCLNLELPLLGVLNLIFLTGILLVWYKFQSKTLIITN